ncbi:MAG TPA: LysM domain-containing protein [Pinirhizobacter sp.]|uniref:LysM peptidoglycan-binding domain-containing protein n=1 Tax=Pinirhizobacter sp. TaxID=2950432 RepID=UPI002C8C923D|nr:LysM domain-containing protein [Pinirhizobacter sp.]HMH67352.1 LysM domain-containing protein [Pinirhizobacter sp.]
MIKKLTVLLGSMFFTVAAYAAAAQLRDGHPDTYTVRRGDTLWAISAKFLQKPWLWPEIWQANPQVRNPHLIYPGDVLNLSMQGGRAHLGLQPRVREDDEAITAIPLKDLKIFLKDMRVMDSDAVKDAPYVMASEEGRLRATPGQKIYVRGDLVGSPGQRFAVVRPTHIFRGFDDEGDGSIGPIVGDELDASVQMQSSPWAEDTRHDGHTGRGDELGTEVTVIGTAELLKEGDPASLLLVDSTREVRPGDRLLPVDDHPYDPYYYPHAPKAMPANGKVIAFTSDAMAAVGSKQVVVLSVGARDGVDNGTTFTIMSKGDKVPDDVGHDSFIRGSGRDVQLPDEYGGHVMVFRTFDKVSYGLIMDGLRPIHKGDNLVAPQ